MAHLRMGILALYAQPGLNAQPLKSTIKLATLTRQIPSFFVFDDKLRFMGYCIGSWSSLPTHTLSGPSQPKDVITLTISSFMPGRVTKVLRYVQQRLEGEFPSGVEVHFQLKRRKFVRTIRSIANAPAIAAEAVDNNFLTLQPVSLQEKFHALMEQAAETGEMLQALACNASFAALPLHLALGSVSTARSLQQYKLYRDDLRHPLGLVTWAWLSARTIERLKHDSLESSHPSEWNEGEHLCFVNIVASPQVLDAVASDVGGLLFPQEPTVLLNVSKGSKRAQLIEIQQSDRHELVQWLKHQLAAPTPTRQATQSVS